MVVTGETIKIVLSAHDPRGVTWVGYSLFPAPNIADSFAVRDTAFADTIAYTVLASWDGNSNLDVWARNPYHQLAWQGVASLVVLNAVRHPYQSVSLGVRAADATYDAVRNLMYFTEPESARVAVLGLTTFTFGAPIHLPMIKRALSVQGIDILPAGDTAIIALPDTAQVALLDRLTNTVTTSGMTGISSPQSLRTTANRKAFTIGQVDSAGSTFSVVVERDLATGRDSIRRDVGHVSAGATLWGDHRITRRSSRSTSPLTLRLPACTCTMGRRMGFPHVAHLALFLGQPRPRRRLATSGTSATCCSMAR